MPLWRSFSIAATLFCLPPLSSVNNYTLRKATLIISKWWKLLWNNLVHNRNSLSSKTYIYIYFYKLVNLLCSFSAHVGWGPLKSADFIAYIRLGVSNLIRYFIVWSKSNVFVVNLQCSREMCYSVVLHVLLQSIQLNWVTLIARLDIIFWEDTVLNTRFLRVHLCPNTCLNN